MQTIAFEVSMWFSICKMEAIVSAVSKCILNCELQLNGIPINKLRLVPPYVPLRKSVLGNSQKRLKDRKLQTLVSFGECR